MSSPGKPFTVVVDATRCGWGDAKVDVTQGGRSIPSETLEVDRGFYEVTFIPTEAAKHKIYVYFNGHEVKGEESSVGQRWCKKQILYFDGTPAL